VYWSDFNERQAPFFEPGIYNKIDKDVYLSPKAVEQESDLPRLALRKDETDFNPIDSSFKVSVVSFVMDKDNAFMGNSVVLNTIVKYEFADMSIGLDTLQSLLDPDSWMLSRHGIKLTVLKLKLQ